jgi:hypothetical protein
MSITRLTELIENSYQRISDSFTRPDNTTEYAAGDVVSDSAVTPTLLDFGTLKHNAVKIVNAQLFIYLNAAIAGMDTWTLHLYRAAITAKNDNSAWDCIAADRVNYIGNFQFAACTDVGSTIISQKTAINQIYDCPNKKLYGILETDGGFVPSAEIEFLINLYVKGC